MSSKHDHLWNNLPFDERKRLHPHMIENHILHLTQTRAQIVAAHRGLIEQIDGQIRNLRESLNARELADA